MPVKATKKPKTFNEFLDSKYGVNGTESRSEFILKVLEYMAVEMKEDVEKAK